MQRWTQTDIDMLRSQTLLKVSLAATAASLARTELETVRMAARLGINVIATPSEDVPYE